MVTHPTTIAAVPPRLTRRALLRGAVAGLAVAATRVGSVPAANPARQSMPVAAQPAPGIDLPAPVIVLTDDRQVPPEICVPLGATVTWENDGTSWVGIAAVNCAFESGKIEPGHAFTHTFHHRGSVTYVCQNHPIRNMTGRILIR